MEQLTANRLDATQRSGRVADAPLRYTPAGSASAALLLPVGLLTRPAWAGWPAFQHSGIGLVTGNTWAPTALQFGGLPFIYGTLVTSVIALLLAVPLAVLIALCRSEVAPSPLGTGLGYVVDLLAAVPSVVYGLWGVFVLVPFLTPIWMKISSGLGFIPLFSDF